MSNLSSDNDILHDSYGSYTSSPPLPPVPTFPCTFNTSCTANNRICDQHVCVLFVKTLTGEVFEIPYGKWENWSWYKQRIHECTGIPVDGFRVVYAGANRDGLTRHSGLQRQSTIHIIPRESMSKSNGQD
ncbi:hypothetical protein I4U23_004243 [Adineta vaga]|nr:hypothetical protein I4U23_004243 [Adineta vaga]